MILRSLAVLSHSSVLGAGAQSADLPPLDGFAVAVSTLPSLRIRVRHSTSGSATWAARSA
jgi:hypothetical protein